MQDCDVKFPCQLRKTYGDVGGAYQSSLWAGPCALLLSAGTERLSVRSGT